MSKYDNQFRLGIAAALAVASVGGAAASSGAISQNIFNIQLAYPGSASSTGGCRIAVVDPGTTVSSTQGTLLPPKYDLRGSLFARPACLRNLQ
jgi:ABC-type cobalamin transport system permease subunit